MLRKVVPAAAVAAVCAATAASAQAMTVSLGQPSLSARVAVTEPVSVSCTPFDPSLTLFSESVNVSIEQAAGQGIAQGSGSVFGFLPVLPFPCDGTAHTVSVGILADPAGPAFHGGPAALSAGANVQAGTPCFPGSTSCFFNLTGESATAGPTTLSMH
jgi:hypothetical protein